LVLGGYIGRHSSPQQTSQQQTYYGKQEKRLALYRTFHLLNSFHRNSGLQAFWLIISNLKNLELLHHPVATVPYRTL
jgi:hypothetical protein